MTKTTLALFLTAALLPAQSIDSAPLKEAADKLIATALKDQIWHAIANAMGK